MERLGQRIIERGLATAADLQRAAEVQVRTGGRLAATLARLGLVSEDEIAALLAEDAGLAVWGREALPEQPVLLDRLNPRFLARRAVLPVAHIDGHVRVALADPTAGFSPTRK